MKSMLEEAMARSASGPVTEDSRVDAELEELLSKMRTNIKIVGVGGGGTNTIARIHEEGVVGAELFTAITIPNDKLLDLVPRMSLNLAFRFADETLMRAIKGLTEIITKPGLVNLDFNDVKTIMKGGGVAMIGMGESQAVGDGRALEAISEAINSPLLEVDISTAHGVLINVTGGNDMTISEAERVAEVVQSKVSPTARIIWGATVDPSLEHTLRVMLVATGVKSKQIVGRRDPSEERARVGVDVIR